MSSSVVDSFGGSFFNWFQDQVLPYLLGSFCILTIILTLILDILLIVTLKKRQMLQDPCNRFVLQLSILDLMAVAFLLIPSTVVAFMKSWELSTYVCYAHAITFIWFYLATFGFLTVMFVERTVKIDNTELYGKVFSSTRWVTVLSFIVWFLTLGISVISYTDWVTVSYDFYHAACISVLTENKYYLSLLFCIGIGISFIAYFVCLIIIIRRKRKNVDQVEPGNKTDGKNVPETIKEENEASTAIKAAWGKNTAAKEAPGKKAATGAKPKSKFASMAARQKLKRAVARAKVTSMFSKLTDEKSDPDLHMAITYLIVYCVMLVCYVPYFSINFADVADSDEIWGGYYSITVILVMLSYCLKPVIYLAHNRNFRKGYKETIPQNVVKKAKDARKSLSNFMEKIDKAMFKTPGKKKLDATLSTHLAANKWLRKVKAKKGATGGAGIWGKPKAPQKQTGSETTTSNSTSNNEDVSTSKVAGTAVAGSVVKNKYTEPKSIRSNPVIDDFNEDKPDVKETNEHENPVRNGIPRQYDQSRGIHTDPYHQPAQNNTANQNRIGIGFQQMENENTSNPVGIGRTEHGYDTGTFPRRSHRNSDATKRRPSLMAQVFDVKDNNDDDMDLAFV